MAQLKAGTSNRLFFIFSTPEDIPDKKETIVKEDLKPGRRIQLKSPAIQPVVSDIFPRKVKSKLVKKIKPALWEKNEENLKNTLLKKEKRKNKLG